VTDLECPRAPTLRIDDDDNQHFGKCARKDGRGRAVMFIEVEEP